MAAHLYKWLNAVSMRLLWQRVMMMMCLDAVHPQKFSLMA